MLILNGLHRKQRFWPAEVTSPKTEEPAGRKLNFLLQELNREINTIGAKAGKAQLSHMVVDIKSELEKIREQMQNVE
ncbi:MAG: DUF1732 domain-containing protein [Deltaproteobacteria bacterium]|nr:DUF1732 domain-containing protein [Deltaproteobacteria bacterium]